MTRVNQEGGLFITALHFHKLEVDVAGRAMDDFGLLRLCLLLALLDRGCPLDTGMLFPRESTSRELKELSGLWSFRADMSPDRKLGFDRAWYKSRLAEVNSTEVSCCCSCCYI